MTPLLQQVSLRRGITDRLRAALPSASEAAVGTLLWGIAMGASALANLLLAAWETLDRVRFVTLLYVLGGMLAFPVG